MWMYVNLYTHVVCTHLYSCTKAPCSPDSINFEVLSAKEIYKHHQTETWEAGVETQKKKLYHY